MRTWDEIVALTKQMMTDRSITLSKMRQVASKYEGDYVLAVPEVPTEPVMPPVTPHLIAEAVDKAAQRAASVEPYLFCPAIDGRKEKGVRSKEYGEIRRKIIRATCHQSKWDLGIRRAYRQLSAYYTCSLVVVPDFNTKMPRIEVRDPLNTFAETVAENQLRAPCYVAFVTTHSGEYIRKRWDKAKSENGGPVTPNRNDILWEVVEWFDEEQVCMGLLGPTYDNYANETYNMAPSIQLAWWPNRLADGMVPVVVPANVTLTRVSSRLSNLIGNVELQAKLLTLDIIAQEKAIWPDMYVIGANGMTPRLLNGEWADGRTGRMNMIADASAIGMLHGTPDQRTQQMVDRLERNFRVSSGLVPQFGGESFGSLRTGRAMDAMMQTAVDPGVQELHEVMEAWLPDMNAAILSTYKAFWPNKQYQLHSGRARDEGLVEFTPSEHIETTLNVIEFPAPGQDAVGLTQVLGSMRGMKAISGDTFRQMHPYITDPEAEEAKVRREDMEMAFSAGLLSQVSNGAVPLLALSLMDEYMAKGDNYFKAFEKADEEARRRQATIAPEPGPGQAMAPESAPGLAGGPQAMVQPPQAPPPEVDVPQGSERIRRLQQAMAAGAR